MKPLIHESVLRDIPLTMIYQMEAVSLWFVDLVASHASNPTSHILCFVYQIVLLTRHLFDSSRSDTMGLNPSATRHDPDWEFPSIPQEGRFENKTIDDRQGPFPMRWRFVVEMPCGVCTPSWGQKRSSTPNIASGLSWIVAQVKLSI